MDGRPREPVAVRRLAVRLADHGRRRGRLGGELRHRRPEQPAAATRTRRSTPPSLELQSERPGTGGADRSSSSRSSQALWADAFGVTIFQFPEILAYNEHVRDERLEHPAVAPDVPQLLGLGGRVLSGGDGSRICARVTPVDSPVGRVDGPGTPADHIEFQRPGGERPSTSTVGRRSVTTFIVRRLVAAFFIVLAASFIVYLLMANAGDPLAFTAEIQNPTQRAGGRSLGDREPPPRRQPRRPLLPVARGRAAPGTSAISARTQQPVIDELTKRVPMTLKLVGAAAILSILVGTCVGIVTAIKQYSGFDYISTFFTFVFFSLPVFWVAVILKGDRRHQLQRLAARRCPLRTVVHRRRWPRWSPGWPTASPAGGRRRRLLIALIAGGFFTARAGLRLGQPVAARSGLRPGRAGDLRRRHRLRRHGGHGRPRQPQGAVHARSPRPPSASCRGSPCRRSSTATP